VERSPLRHHPSYRTLLLFARTTIPRTQTVIYPSKRRTFVDKTTRDIISLTNNRYDFAPVSNEQEQLPCIIIATMTELPRVELAKLGIV